LRELRAFARPTAGLQKAVAAVASPLVIELAYGETRSREASIVNTANQRQAGIASARLLGKSDIAEFIQ
jgi:hypothetical protein